MDSIKTLMDKKQYELVIKITANDKDINSLFYRVSAFLAIGKGEDALKVIEDNRLILQSNLPFLMKVHIEILCILGQFDKAYKEIKYYESLPYYSQEVEELFASLPEYIEMEKSKAFGGKQLSDDEIRLKLRSSNKEDVLICLDLLRERNISNFFNDLQYVMLEEKKQSLRSFALLLLVQQKINRPFKFKHIDQIIEVNPSLIEPPFVGDAFNNLVRKMEIEYKNPSMSENAIQILSSYLLYIYPVAINEEMDVVIEALKEISIEYLSMEKEDLSTRCQKRNIDEMKVKNLIACIKMALQDF